MRMLVSFSQAQMSTADDQSALAGITPVGAPEYTDIYTTPDQLTEGLLTLSLMPRSRWQTLLNLETIKVSGVMLPRSALADANSNGISPRSHQRRQRKHRFSCRPLPASRLASTCRPLRHLKRMSPTRGDLISPLGSLRATLPGAWPERIPREIVSFLSVQRLLLTVQSTRSLST